MSDLETAQRRFMRPEPVLLFQKDARLNVDKFYRLQLVDKEPLWSVMMQWGRAGTEGQKDEKTWDAQQAAERFGLEKIAEKVKKGYRLETPDERGLRAMLTGEVLEGASLDAAMKKLGDDIMALSKTMVPAGDALQKFGEAVAGKCKHERRVNMVDDWNPLLREKCIDCEREIRTKRPNPNYVPNRSNRGLRPPPPGPIIMEPFKEEDVVKRLKEELAKELAKVDDLMDRPMVLRPPVRRAGTPPPCSHRRLDKRAPGLYVCSDCGARNPPGTPPPYPLSGGPDRAPSPETILTMKPKRKIVLD